MELHEWFTEMIASNAFACPKCHERMTLRDTESIGLHRPERYDPSPSSSLQVMMHCPTRTATSRNARKWHAPYHLRERGHFYWGFLKRGR
jgi:hypothetical protein